MAQKKVIEHDVNEESFEMKEAEVELENRDKKEDQQRKMAWIAMISMIILTAFMFLPIVSPERITALSDLLSMFYIAQAGIVATFFGSQAYMSVTRS